MTDKASPATATGNESAEGNTVSLRGKRENVEGVIVHVTDAIRIRCELNIKGSRVRITPDSGQIAQGCRLVAFSMQYP